MGKLSDWMTVVALANGMIGGTILVLPVMALKAGYLLIPTISILLGVLSLYTTIIVRQHLGNFRTFDEALLAHFRKARYLVFYNLIIFSSLCALLLIYFDLLVKQLEGLIGIKVGYSVGLQKYIETYLPFALSVVVFVLVLIMRKFQFGADLLAYGVISIIGYCLFLVWVQVTAPSTVPGTNPPITRHLPAVHPLFVDMTASLSLAYSIQLFMIPILRRNPNKQNHKKLIVITFIIGIIVYIYIAYGCYGILNREILGRPETIQDYFMDENGNSEWQVLIIDALYAIHLLSAFPQFLIIAKLRLISVIKSISNQQIQIVDSQRNQNHLGAVRVPIYQQNNQGRVLQQEEKSDESESEHESPDLSFLEVVFYICFIAFCCLIKVIGVKISFIVMINGAVFCMLYVFLIPVWMHLNCIYLSDDVIELPTHQAVQELDKDFSVPNYVQQQEYEDKEHKMRTIGQQQLMINPINEQVSQRGSALQDNGKRLDGLVTAEKNGLYICPCRIQFQKKSLIRQRLQLLLQISIVCFGLFTMIYTFYTLLAEKGEGD